MLLNRYVFLILKDSGTSMILEYLLRWFDPKALSEIAMIRTIISQVETPEIKAMAEIVLSNILRPVSWQKNSSLRTQKEVTTYIEGKALQAFVEQIRCQREKMCLYLSLIQNAQRLPEHEVITGDTRKLDFSSTSVCWCL